MNNLILLSEQELQQKINEAVESRMLAMYPKKVELKKTNLDISEAIVFLASIGYKCSTSLIYKASMTDEIPKTKFGRRMVFNADELSKWVDSKKQKTIDISTAVAHSANSKLKRI